MGSCCMREVSADLPQDKPTIQPSPLPPAPSAKPEDPPKRALTTHFANKSPDLRSTEEAKASKMRRQNSEFVPKTAPEEAKTERNQPLSLDIPVMQLHRPFEDVYEPKTASGPGKLFLAVHRITKVTRIVKQLPRLTSRKGKDPNSDLQSRLEASIGVSHPGLLQADAVLYNRREIYVVSENLSLVKVVEYSEIAEKLTEGTIKHLAKQLFRAVAHIHAQSLVLKTLSIASILFYICKDSGIRLKLLSIGGWEEESKGSTVKSRAFYTAPEAFGGKFTEKSDLWSCGVVLYLLLAGTTPFQGKNAEMLRGAMLKGAKFPASEWSRFDPRAKGLVGGLLAKEPRSRPTAVECLQHPWLQDSASAPALLPAAMANMRKFQGGEPFKLAILSFIARNVLSPVDKQPLDDVFAYLNESGSGFLTSTELVQAFAQVNRAEFSQMLASAVLTALHLPTHSPLTYSQFLLTATDYQALTKVSTLKVAFDLLDPDCSGFIMVEEWKTAMNFKGGDQEWREVMREWDRDASGTLSFGQFVKLARGIVGEVRGLA